MWTMNIDQDFLEGLNEVQLLSLQQLRARVEDYLCPAVDDHRLYWFLKGKKFDVDKAEKCVLEHLQFREKMRLDVICEEYKPKEVIEKYVHQYHIGYDKEGNSVLGVLTGITDVKGVACSTTRTDQLKALLYFSELNLRKTQEESKKRGNNGRRGVVIFDLNGLRLRQIMDRRVGQAFISLSRILAHNYPGMVKRAYVINAPSFFLHWFNFMKTFIPVDVKGVFIYGREGWKDALLETIDANILPAIFGGKKTDPDGNPKCLTMFNWETKVPTSYYLKNKSTKFIDDPFTKLTTVRERTYYNQEVCVQKANSVLCWTFQTIHYNIGFAIYYVPNGVKPMPKVSMPKFSKSFRHRVRRNSRDGHDIIVPLERAESHLFPEEGELVCEKAGLYLIHFDNTFSWNTPKKLYFRIEVKPPTKDATEIRDEDDEDAEIFYDPLIDESEMEEIPL